MKKKTTVSFLLLLLLVPFQNQTSRYIFPVFKLSLLNYSSHLNLKRFKNRKCSYLHRSNQTSQTNSGNIRKPQNNRQTSKLNVFTNWATNVQHLENALQMDPNKKLRKIQLSQACRFIKFVKSTLKRSPTYMSHKPLHQQLCLSRV